MSAQVLLYYRTRANTLPTTLTQCWGVWLAARSATTLNTMGDQDIPSCNIAYDGDGEPQERNIEYEGMRGDFVSSLVEQMNASTTTSIVVQSF